MNLSTDDRQSGYDEYVKEGFVQTHKKGLAVLAIVVVAFIGFVGFNSYEGTVVQTSVVQGKVTNINVVGGASGAPAPAGVGAGTTSSGSAIVTISLGSSSFSQVLQCTSFSFRLNQNVSVADQTLQSGQHRYVPDIACRGGVSQFSALHITQTSSSSTTT